MRASAIPLGRDTGAPVLHDPAFGEHPLLVELQKEKRRSDRSGLPLSLVTFRFSGHAEERAAGIARLLSLLRGRVRESDVVGCLGPDTVAIILPDSRADGAAAFVRKVTSKWDAAPFQVTSETYPDQVFACLASGAPLPATPDALLTHAADGPRRFAVLVKRVLDVLAVACLLLLLAPVMTAVAIAVKLSSPGPVIFRQTRLGKGAVPFTFYKFRSMKVGNDDRAHREFVSMLITGQHDTLQPQVGAGPHYKIRNDPRVTPIGRFIRRTSLDELPQLFNVLKGDMSLVGPRPPLPYEVEKYRSWHLRRVLEVRPGITGLWQVEGRSKVTFDEMVRMDIRYVRNWSLMLDLRILLKTIKVVFGADGAG